MRDNGLLDCESALWNEFRDHVRRTRVNGIDTISESVTGFRVWLGEQLVGLRQSLKLQVAATVFPALFTNSRTREDWDEAGALNEATRLSLGVADILCQKAVEGK